MNGNGIVRRMDELGRIVIPKELRRTLRLREGDEMEIFSEGEKLVIKKYSRFETFVRTTESAARALHDRTGCTVLIVASDEIVAAAGKRKKELTGKSVSRQLADMIAEKKTVTRAAAGEFSPAEDVSLPADGVAAAPVAAAGDVLGTVVCVGDGAAERADYLEFTAELLAAVLAE